MTVQEFDLQFEILYQNITANAAPGLDVFEKSSFLTKAQKELIIGVYTGALGSASFEGTEDVRQYINELIKVYETSTPEIGQIGLSDTSKFFRIPEDVWFRILEYVNYDDGEFDCPSKITSVKVVPITHDEYHSIKDNPFRGATDRRILRLDYSGNIIELISKHNVGTYGLRYISAPQPIVLADLDLGLTIDGVNTLTECQLNPVFHETILNRAVELAKISWQGAANSKV